MKIAVFKINRRDIVAAIFLIAEGHDSVLQHELPFSERGNDSWGETRAEINHGRCKGFSIDEH